MKAGTELSSVQETGGRRSNATSTDVHHRNDEQDALHSSFSFFKQPLVPLHYIVVFFACQPHIYVSLRNLVQVSHVRHGLPDKAYHQKLAIDRVKLELVQHVKIFNLSC